MTTVELELSNNNKTTKIHFPTYSSFFIKKSNEHDSSEIWKLKTTLSAVLVFRY